MLFRLSALMTVLALFCVGPLGIARSEPASVPNHNLAGRLVGETVADRHSEYYRFETHVLVSVDGKRRYRIQIGIPRTSASNEGRATLYMLDGNAAIDTLTDQDLEFLSTRSAPVLVAIGYDVPTRNDVISRAYDYTPPVIQNGQPIAEPLVRGRLGGGADIFLRLIEDEIKPLVHSRAGLSGPEYLWGHSYGGLFALHVLFSRPAAFSRYIVGDPSVWWHEGALIREWESFDTSRAVGKQVAILVGTKPRPADRPLPYDPVITGQDGKQIDLRNVVGEMADSLRQGGVDVSYQSFAQYGHGDMMRVSLERALHIASKP